MNLFWIGIAVTLIVFSALLPDDAAIFLDLVDIWIRSAWVWVQGQWFKTCLWLRLQWDGSWIKWLLWVIKQRAQHNRNNTQKETND